MVSHTHRPLSLLTLLSSPTFCLFFGRLYLLLILFTSTAHLLYTDAYAQNTPAVQDTTQKTSTPAGPPKSLDRVPIPHNRGFWKTFLFWCGGFFCMYLVARRMFREHINEHRTLKRFRDEIGEFFPEFNLANLKKWVDRASEHVYMGYQTGTFNSMKSFSTEHFQTKFEDSTHQKDLFPESTLNYIIKVHPLGAYLLPEETVPPKGVELVLRIEQSVNTPYEKKGKTKTKRTQEQWIWVLRHTGVTWSVHDLYQADGDITDLNEHDPLPPLMEWKRPDHVKVRLMTPEELEEERKKARKNAETRKKYRELES